MDFGVLQIIFLTRIKDFVKPIFARIKILYLVQFISFLLCFGTYLLL